MRFGRLGSALALAGLLAAPLAAEQSTKKFDWAPINGVQDINISAGDIMIGQVTFNTGSTLKGTPLRKSSADVRVRIDNNGLTDQQVGVAVVVFDVEGNVVGAGSNGTKWGYLTKGDRTYYTIDFPYVYRNLDKAATFMVSIETQGKSSKPSKSSSTTSSTTSSSTVESEPLSPTPVPK